MNQTKPMNSSRFTGSTRGFTLIELLVVIAIIAILAGLLLPAISQGVGKSKVSKAKTEINGIVAAINQYDTAYSRLPVSTLAAGAVNSTYPDFTFGTVNNGTNEVSGRTQQSLYAISNPAGYVADNRDVIAILMALPLFPDNVTQTSDANNSKNPQKTPFLNAKLTGDNASPGIGNDYVFRDPWGNPYIISLDLNYDNRTRDAFYSSDTVSATPNGSTTGFNGLNETAGPNTFEANTTVMVWSFGPDGTVDPTVKANVGANKDNILSWAN